MIIAWTDFGETHTKRIECRDEAERFAIELIEKGADGIATEPIKG